jgi:hypothetical protein
MVAKATPTAVAADVPSYRIQQHTRHKSAELVTRCVREADKVRMGSSVSVLTKRG